TDFPVTPINLSLAPAFRLSPNSQRQMRSAQREDELDRKRNPARTRRSPAPTLGLDERSRSLFGKSQQHPVAVWPPLLFEILACDTEKFPACRIVDKDGPVLPIDARHHHVV